MDRRIFGQRLVILYIRILARGGICLEKGFFSKMKRELRADTFTLLRGIRLFKKLHLIDKWGQVTFCDESRKAYMRQYMRTYRKTVPKDKLSNEIKRIKKKVDFDNFDVLDKVILEELVLIMAEVLCLDNDKCILIDGVETEVHFVKSIYLKLTHEHLLFAYGKYMDVSTKITKLKDYLRTLLYNVYFEMAPFYTNQVNYET